MTILENHMERQKVHESEVLVRKELTGIVVGIANAITR